MASIKISQLTDSQQFHDSFLRELTDVESRTLKGGVSGLDALLALGLRLGSQDSQLQDQEVEVRDIGSIVIKVEDGNLVVEKSP